jgi:hypothetical protein
VNASMNKHSAEATWCLLKDISHVVSSSCEQKKRQKVTNAFYCYVSLSMSKQEEARFKPIQDWLFSFFSLFFPPLICKPPTTKHETTRHYTTPTQQSEKRVKEHTLLIHCTRPTSFTSYNYSRRLVVPFVLTN